jgi:hypothetical protein
VNAPIDQLHAECIAAADGVHRRFAMARLEAAAQVSAIGLRLERRLLMTNKDKGTR